MITYLLIGAAFGCIAIYVNWEDCVTWLDVFKIVLFVLLMIPVWPL